MYNKIKKIGGTIGAMFGASSFLGEDDIRLFIVKGIYVLVAFLVIFFCLASPMGRKLIKTFKGK